MWFILIAIVSSCWAMDPARPSTPTPKSYASSATSDLAIDLKPSAVLTELANRFQIPYELYHKSWLSVIETFFNSNTHFLQIFNSLALETDSITEIDQCVFETDDKENPLYAKRFKTQMATLNTWRAQMIGNVIGMRDKAFKKCDGEKKERLIEALASLTNDIDLMKQQQIKSDICRKIASINMELEAIESVSDEFLIQEFAKQLSAAKSKAKQYLDRIRDPEKPLKSEKDFNTFTREFRLKIYNEADQLFVRFQDIWQHEIYGPANKIMEFQSEIYRKLFDIFNVKDAPRTPQRKRVVSFGAKHSSVPPSPGEDVFDTERLTDVLTQKMKLNESPAKSPESEFFTESHNVALNNFKVYKAIRIIVNKFDSYDFETHQAIVETTEGKEIHFPKDEIFQDINAGVCYYSSEFHTMLEKMEKICDADEGLKSSISKISNNLPETALGMVLSISQNVKKLGSKFGRTYQKIRALLRIYQECLQGVRTLVQEIELGHPTDLLVLQARERLPEVMPYMELYESLHELIATAKSIVDELVEIESDVQARIKDSLKDLESVPVSESNDEKTLKKHIKHTPTRRESKLGVLKGGNLPHRMKIPMHFKEPSKTLSNDELHASHSEASTTKSPTLMPSAFDSDEFEMDPFGSDISDIDDDDSSHCSTM